MAHLLTRDQAQRIESLITEVERSTAGEIVTVVVARCDDYASWRIPWIAGLTVASSLALYLGAPAIPVEWIFVAQLPVGVALWCISGLSPVLRRMLPRTSIDATVAARATELFVERGVTETRDRSGVLLLIAELEHRVEILADRGIHSRVGSEGWERHTRRIGEAIAQGHAADGIYGAVEEIGRILQESFPARPDDQNELPDSIHRAD